LARIYTVEKQQSIILNCLGKEGEGINSWKQKNKKVVLSQGNRAMSRVIACYQTGMTMKSSILLPN